MTRRRLFWILAVVVLLPLMLVVAFAVAAPHLAAWVVASRLPLRIDHDHVITSIRASSGNPDDALAFDALVPVAIAEQLVRTRRWIPPFLLRSGQEIGGLRTVAEGETLRWRLRLGATGDNAVHAALCASVVDRALADAARKPITVFGQPGSWAASLQRGRVEWTAAGDQRRLRCTAAGHLRVTSVVFNIELPISRMVIEATIDGRTLVSVTVSELACGDNPTPQGLADSIATAVRQSLTDALARLRSPLPGFPITIDIVPGDRATALP